MAEVTGNGTTIESLVEMYDEKVFAELAVFPRLSDQELGQLRNHYRSELGMVMIAGFLGAQNSSPRSVLQEMKLSRHTAEASYGGYLLGPYAFDDKPWTNAVGIWVEATKQQA